MTSPKSIVRQQRLKAEKLNGRTVPGDMEYKKSQMKHDADVLALNELKWRAELVGTIMIPPVNNNNTEFVSDDVIQSGTGEEQELYSRESITDFVNIFLAKAKQEATTQNHKQPLGSGPLNNSESPDGSKHNN